MATAGVLQFKAGDRSDRCNQRINPRQLAFVSSVIGTNRALLRHQRAQYNTPGLIHEQTGSIPIIRASSDGFRRRAL
jgi:hypothetical protein